MTPRERLMTAYRGETPDRVPINVRGVHVLDDNWVNARDTSWTPLIEIVAAECDPVASFGIDSGWLLNGSPSIQMEHRSHDRGDWVYEESIVTTPQGPLNYVRRVSKNEYSSLTDTFWITDDDRDLKRFLSVDWEPSTPDMSGFAAFTERIGERGVITFGHLDPMGCVHELLGSEKIALWSIERPADLDMLIELFTARLLTWIDSIIAQGVKGVCGFVGAEYCLPPLMPPRSFRRWVTEPMKRITERIHAAGSIAHIHSHGPLNDVLEQFVEMGGDVLHPIEAPPMGDVPLADAKRRIGAEICLEGNIQIGDLFGGTEAEVREITRRAIEEGKPGGGFVFCPTASPYTPRLSDQVVRNYLAMIETAIEVRNY